MKSAIGAAFAVICLLAASAAGPANPASQAGASRTVSPDVLFAQGEFEQARAAYETVPKSSPGYETALRQLGAIALYQNHLEQAEVMLRNARALNPADTHGATFLAETLNREGKFTEMSQLLRQLGRPERAAEFDLFGKAVPYRLPGHPAAVTVGFLQTDPLPAVLAKANGLEGLFLIDTGAAEIVLDPEFAREAHVQSTGHDEGTFAGGRKGAISFGRIAQFVLPGVEMDDVPAMLISTRGFSSAARGKKVAGVIGTEYLSRFRATLDYPQDRLVLEPRDAAAPSGGHIADVPFWFLGDHFLVAPGRLGQAPKQLFLVDTGLAGFAFTGPDSTLRDAGIPVPTPQAPPPGAPVGRAPVAKFPIAMLSLGSLAEKNLTGLYGPFPPGLENGLGVHVGGIVSHAFFHPYAVTFDFVAMKIGFRKSHCKGCD